MQFLFKHATSIQASSGSIQAWLQFKYGFDSRIAPIQALGFYSGVGGFCSSAASISYFEEPDDERPRRLLRFGLRLFDRLVFEDFDEDLKKI